LILGGVGALVLFFLVALGVWYFVFHKPAAPKSVVTTQKAAEPQPTAKTSSMADKAKDVLPFKTESKKETRSEASAAPKQTAPSAGEQPIVPVNDFTGG
jgi:cytoskeletal protein RodZ